MESADNSTLCWGSTYDGELGLGGIEEEQVSIPREVPALRDVQVASITCGYKHTVFLLAGGTLCSCGNNDYGQLGHDNLNKKKPSTITTLETQVVVSVDCGAQHTVAVTDTGQMFSWGSNQHGQLGRGYTDEPYTRTPKLVKSLSTSFIVALSCGENHNMALTNDGHLYTWGANSHGQLGLGVFSPKVDTPQRVSSLSGVPLAQAMAGGQHSLALTKSGALFSFGKNSFGQLGIGNQEDRFYPTLVKQLRYQRVTYVDAGEDHTAALTADGGLFTFGAGSHGQLGHNSTNNELQPRKVFELMGSMVTQVAAGRRHTLAYVPISGRIYAFGLGGNGQLGVGEFHNRNSPTTVKGPFIPLRPSSACPNQLPISDKLPPCVVNRIYCGGDRSFTTTTALRLNRSPYNCRIPDPRSQILVLTNEKVNEWVSVPASFKPSHETIEGLEVIFRSLSCLNASCLLPDGQHFGCSSKNHGLNLDEAYETFRRIRSLPNKVLANMVDGLIENSVLPALTTNLPDTEAMRVFLLLPCCHLFEKPQYYSTVHCPFARTITSLGKTPAKIIDLWWAQLPAEYLHRLVKLYKQVVLHVLHLPAPNSEREVNARQASLTPCMDMLKKLNDVNVQNGLIIPYDAFYIPELKEKLDIRSDYINWLKQSGRGQPVLDILELMEEFLAFMLGSDPPDKGGPSLPMVIPFLQHVFQVQGRPLSFCNYPFVFDGQAKTLLLQTDALIQMQVAIDEVCRRNMTSLIIPEIDPINPCLILYVTRDNIVQDTINQLTKQGSCDFKKPLKVIFLGEEAVDAGGVVKEFFLLILREVVDPKYGMFQYFEESRLFWFNSATFEDPVMFTLIGVLCGLAIYNAIIIDLKFPLGLFKKLLRQPVTLDDLTELDPTLGRSLQDLLDYGGDDVEDVFCLTFEMSRESYGQTHNIELARGGSKIPVSKANKKEYVDAYIDYIFNTACHEQFQAFDDGFHRVCGGRVLALFHPQELQAMVVGNENYEWEILEQNCEYKSDYHQNHPTITYFWQVFRRLSLEDKKKFLRFLTGSDRIPIHGMKAIKMFIQPTGGGDNYLPVAHTCFNLLDLPRYTRPERLERKLLTAIQQTEGFGIV